MNTIFRLLTQPSQIRNVHKKLSSSAKADAVITENPGKSLDELVANKKLNNDQKNQILKKPGLQTQLAQLEDQLSQYRTFAQELEERFSREKATLAEAHEQEIAQLKEEIATQSQALKVKDIDEELKVISQFLHAAASKRQSEGADSDEGRAFEGILLQVYQGNDTALSTLRNLITGSEEKVNDTENTPLDFTFAQVKQAALTEAAELAAGGEDEPAVPESGTDPTIAHAGLTELDDTTAIPIRTNGRPQDDTTFAPQQVSTTAEAANAVAESSWNPDASMTTDASANGEEWVQVPRDPADTDTGLTATPAAPQTGSWAEEVATTAAEEKPRAENDGFEQVRGRHGEGRGRGRGSRGGDPRGDFRGRARGGRGGENFRGGRGAMRGERGQRGGRAEGRAEGRSDGRGSQS